jgi:phosphonate transport system ATP-binding protein
MAIIRATNLRKVYPNGTTGLDRLSLEVQPGELVGVLGSSGAGKTSFFRLLNGSLRPTAGELEVLGRRLDQRVSTAEMRRLRSELALINQHHNVIPPLSVLQNILIGRLGRTNTFRALTGFFNVRENERLQAAEAAALVGLAPKLYNRAEDLSGGQQQRVAIARAIMQGAKILLADEPIASVDMRNAALILDLFKRVNEELGVTVMINLHQLDFAVRYCPRILVFKAGNLAYDGSPEGLGNFNIYDEPPKIEEPDALDGEIVGQPTLTKAAMLEEAEMGEIPGNRHNND